MLWSVCTTVCVLTAVSTVTGQSEVVHTRYGALQGTRTRIGLDSYVDSFYNIPYAKPPTGYLRFHKPVVNEAWTGIRDATTPGPMCPQQPFSFTSTQAYKGSEDCLYLNVHTPKHAVSSGSLPVMVWIHGGGFYFGSGKLYNGTRLASNGVVVVTINYRLGALGFLSTQDGASAGNYGLWDQVRALQWVRDVISAFKGDPNDVTIFGESAGSISVSLLVLSKEARGLFTKAIMESGVSLSPGAVWAPGTKPDPSSQATELASRLGCAAADSTRLLACLRTKDPQSIVQATQDSQQDAAGLLSFGAVAETTFGQFGMFSGLPEVILSNGWFNNVTVMRGFNKDEWAWRQGNIDPDDDGLTMEEFQNLTRGFIDFYVKNQYSLDPDRIMDLVVDTYVTRPNINDPEQLRAAYIRIMSDFIFIAPTYKEQRLYFNAHGKTEYLYRFSFRSANRRNHYWQGVVHTDEVAYVFGKPFTNDPTRTGSMVSNWTDDDRRVSQNMMTMWTNFAKYGNPTPDGSVTKWLPWTLATPTYLDLGIQTTMVGAPDTAAINLWNDVIPNSGIAVIG